MKKIFILSAIILVLNGCAFAQEPIKASVSMADITVFSNDKNLFGLQDKSGNIIVEPQYKKLIRLGDSSWIVLKKTKYGLIDNNGNYLIEPKYRHVDRILGKYLKIGNSNNFAIYNEKGEVIIPPEYSSIDILFGGMFLTKKNYKYGVCDRNGNVILDNIFDDIYMPKPNIMRIQYNGQWYEIEQVSSETLTLPDDVTKIKENENFKITEIINNPIPATGYSVVTATDYFIKLFSSISPAYEDTIDELMLSKGADTVNIFMRASWIPKFPITYIKKYYINVRTPNNGPLADVKQNLKNQMNDDNQ